MAHGFDAHPHLAEFFFPQLAQFRALQHGCDHRAAVGRRVGIVGADDDFELRQDARGFVRRLAQHRQRAYAFAVQAETFRKRGSHQKIQTGFDELVYDRAIFGDAVAKALVSHVQKRGEFTRFDRIDHFVPLLRRDVVAGGVVAASVQHDDGARGGGVQAVKHALEIHAARGSVVIRISLDGETGSGKQSSVVFPARVADQHLGCGVEFL